MSCFRTKAFTSAGFSGYTAPSWVMEVSDNFCYRISTASLVGRMWESRILVGLDVFGLRGGILHFGLHRRC